MMHHRIPTEHKTVSYRPGQLQRTPSPEFNFAPARGMREPGTNYLTIITAPDPEPARYLIKPSRARNPKKK